MSACLVGVRCRYDGTSRETPELRRRLAEVHVIPVCPEQLGGMPTPRVRCDVEGGTGADVLTGRARVVDAAGADRTAEFLRGAEEAAALARRFGASRAVLKAGSPSCDATVGVAAASLREAGLEIESAD